MGIKKYSSYAEIELELEILKLKKEIHYQKLVLSIQKTKEDLTLPNLTKGFFGSYKSVLSNSFSSIIEIVLPFIIDWILKKKRGD